ncbi:MAG: metal-sensitive transcriptional regulator [Salinibacterium sp.]|nr:metal-sensitive transcriptional regulator [Salinibacterium sp.]
MTTDSPAENTRKIVNRLKRAQGQLGALIAAVENGNDCRAVITQLSAVSSALDRAGFAIVASAMKDCIDEGENGDLSVDDLEKLFLTLA